jgi:protein phosphatase
MFLKIPELSLVILVGVSSAGKSTFAHKHFKATEIVSSDHYRNVVCDDENSLEASQDAFELVHTIVEKRLKRGLLTVVDATSVLPYARKTLLELAKKYHAKPVVVVLDTPEELIRQRHEARNDRNFDYEAVIVPQRYNLRRAIHQLPQEGFKHIFVLDTIENIENATFIREKARSNKKTETGNFDIIGDIHGCFTELKILLGKLNYQLSARESKTETGKLLYYDIQCPENHRLIFVGDLTDRGDNSPEVLKVVMSAVRSGKAFCVQGNHDFKLLQKLSGKNVKVSHGLEITLAQLANEKAEFLADVEQFLENLAAHYVFDEGKLVVAHAGLREEMHNRSSGAIRNFCLYGETNGETDEYGLPVRINWAADYKGKAMVVYGHTPMLESRWQNNTINIDTGCVFGGMLTALKYPEKKLMAVKAKKLYYESPRPLL